MTLGGGCFAIDNDKAIKPLEYMKLKGKLGAKLKVKPKDRTFQKYERCLL